MKLLITLMTALLLSPLAQAKKTDYQKAKVKWMSVTCAQLQSTLLSYDIVKYGGHTLYSKNIAPSPERDEICERFHGYNFQASSALPTRTKDKRGIIKNMCPLNRVAFQCNRPTEN